MKMKTKNIFISLENHEQITWFFENHVVHEENWMINKYIIHIIMMRVDKLII